MNGLVDSIGFILELIQILNEQTYQGFDTPVYCWVWKAAVSFCLRSDNVRPVLDMGNIQSRGSCTGTYSLGCLMEMYAAKTLACMWYCLDPSSWKYTQGGQIVIYCFLKLVYIQVSMLMLGGAVLGLNCFVTWWLIWGPFWKLKTYWSFSGITSRRITAFKACKCST